MQNSIQVAAAQDGLTLKAFRGDGGVLLGFDLDQRQQTSPALLCNAPHPMEQPLIC